VVHLHLKEYLDAVGVGLGINDLVMFGTEDELIFVASTLALLHREAAAWALPAIGYYVRHFSNDGTILKSRVGRDQAALAARKSANTPGLQKESLHVCRASRAAHL
jgi:hypothetical protein